MSDRQPVRYGCWAGRPNGYPECAENCIEKVFGTHDYVSHQCIRKRGHGPNGLYCKQHSKRRQEKP